MSFTTMIVFALHGLICKHTYPDSFVLLSTSVVKGAQLSRLS